MVPGTSRPSTENLESWLRYYDDLGIHSFYRDRPIWLIRVAAEPVAQPAEEATQELMAKSKSSAASSSAAPSASPLLPAPAPNAARLPGIVQRPVAI